MTFFLYVLIGLVISLIFMLIPQTEIASPLLFFLLTLTWFPLFLIGIILITFHERHKMMI